MFDKIPCIVSPRFFTICRERGYDDLADFLELDRLDLQSCFYSTDQARIALMFDIPADKAFVTKSIHGVRTTPYRLVQGDRQIDHDKLAAVFDIRGPIEEAISLFVLTPDIIHKLMRDNAVQLKRVWGNHASDKPTGV